MTGSRKSKVESMVKKQIAASHSIKMRGGKKRFDN
jgi:hypothetical protein